MSNSKGSSFNHSAKLLASITRDPNYVRVQQGLDGPAPGKEWDNRFTNQRIPQYDAVNDRFCKFSMKKRSTSKGRKQLPPKQSSFAMQQWGAAPPPPTVGGPSVGATTLHGRPLLNQPALPAGDTNLSQTIPGAKGAAGAKGPAEAPMMQLPPGQSVETMFAKSKQRIVKLWDELGVAEGERLQFAQHAMSSATLEHVQAINEEIQCLLDRRNGAVQVEKAIEVREGFMYLLQELSERYSTSPMDKDRAIRELNALTVPFRNSSLDVVEAIQRWRDSLRSPGTPPPYLWKGVSYLHKMSSDLFFLVHSRLGQLLEYDLRNNPLLDPRRTLDVGTGGGRLPPLRRAKDTNKDLPKERIDRAEKVLLEEAQRQQSLTAARSTMVSADAPQPEGVHAGEEAHLDQLAREDEEHKQLIAEEDEWMQRQQNELNAVDQQFTAAVKIQTSYRGYIARKYVRAKVVQRVSAIRMQTASRQFLAKLKVSKLREQVGAARKLQALQRGIMTRTRIDTIRTHHHAATDIQRVFRGYLGRRYADMLAYLRYSAVCVQRVWRGHCARKRVRGILHDGRSTAAVMIQAHWRGFMIRKNPKYNTKKISAAIKLQAFARGVIDRQFAKELAHERFMATRIQSWYRMHLAQKRANAIRESKIDRSWRHHLAAAENAATSIQSMWRMVVAKREVEERRLSRDASLAAQAKKKIAEETEREQRLDMHRNVCATRIQALYRGHSDRKRVQMLRMLNHFATQMQRVVRGHLGRRAAERQKVILFENLQAMSKMSVSPVQSPLSIIQETLRTADTSRVEVDTDDAPTPATKLDLGDTPVGTPKASEIPVEQEPAIAPVAVEQPVVPAEESPLAVPVAEEATPALAETVETTSEPVVDTDAAARTITNAVRGAAASNTQKRRVKMSVDSEAPAAIEQEKEHAARIIQRFGRICVAHHRVADYKDKQLHHSAVAKLQADRQLENYAATILQHRLVAFLRCFMARKERAKRQKANEREAIQQEKNYAATSVQSVSHIAAAQKRRQAKQQERTAMEQRVVEQEQLVAAEKLQGFGRRVATRNKVRVAKATAAQELAIAQERDFAVSKIQSACRAQLARTVAAFRRKEQEEVAAKEEQAAIEQEAAFPEATAEHTASPTSSPTKVSESGASSPDLLGHEDATEKKQKRRASLQGVKPRFPDDLPPEHEHKVYPKDEDIPIRPPVEPHVQFDKEAENSINKTHKVYPKDEQMPVHFPERAEPHVSFDPKTTDEKDHKVYPPDADLNLGRAAPVKMSSPTVAAPLTPMLPELDEAPPATFAVDDATTADVPPPVKEEPKDDILSRVEALQRQLQDAQSAMDKRIEEEVARRVEERVQATLKETSTPAEPEQPVAKEEDAQPTTTEEPAAVTPQEVVEAPLPAARVSPQAKVAEEPTSVAPVQEPQETVASVVVDTEPVISNEPSPVGPTESSEHEEHTMAREDLAVVAQSFVQDILVKAAQRATELQEQRVAAAVESEPLQEDAVVMEKEVKPHVQPKTAPVVEPDEKVGPTDASIAALQGQLRAVTATNLVIGIWQRRLRQKIGERRISAAKVIQRLSRVFVAKVRVQRRRLEKKAAFEVANKEAIDAINAEKRREEEMRVAKTVADTTRRENRAAITIQCAYRCYNARFMLAWKLKARQEKRREQAEAEAARQTNEAATKIQCMYRSHAARATVTQKRAERDVTKKHNKEEEARQNAAALKIQCAYRQFNARFEANWRREDQQRQKAREGAAREATEQRALHAIQQKAIDSDVHAEQSKAAITIQCAYRSFNARFERRWRQEAKDKKAYDKHAAVLAGFMQPIGRGVKDRYALRLTQATRANEQLIAEEEERLADASAVAVIDSVLRQRAAEDEEL